MKPQKRKSKTIPATKIILEDHDGRPVVLEIERFQIHPPDQKPLPRLDRRPMDLPYGLSWYKIVNYLEQLAQAAEIEDGEDFDHARFALENITISLVERLNAMTEKQPHLWDGAGQYCMAWPVLLSPHPMYRARAEAQIKRMKVGAAARLRADGKSRWNTDQNPFADVAFQLIEHLEAAQLRSMCWPHIAEDALQGWRKEALSLPWLEHETWRNWWKVARTAFLEAYPHPEEIPMLADLISKRPSQMHRVPSRILGEIEEAFETLARNHDQWTKDFKCQLALARVQGKKFRAARAARLARAAKKSPPARPK